MKRVPFNEPLLLPEFPDLLKKCFANKHLSGLGPLSRLCEEELHKITRAKTLLTTSATSSLEMMALLLGVSSGDEIILPSFTFVSTANAFALRGAILKFGDNDEFGNLLPSEVERLATARTKAVVAVHYAGASADMDRLQEICRHKKITLLEDAAQAIGSKFKKQSLGTMGALGCFSFHETKNVGCGEGGSLLVNDSEVYLERAEFIREKGTNRRKFVEGFADKYSWVDIGSSYVLSELNACLLHPQLVRLEEISKKRKQLWQNYEAALMAPFAHIGADTLKVPAHNESNFHIFAVIFRSLEIRRSFIQFMQSRGITTPFHYVSLHTSPYGSKYFDASSEPRLRNCERLSDGLVRLPLFYNLEDTDQNYVTEAALEWCRGQK